jgi:cell wall-associated NlpC family hydrolase
LKKIFLLSAVAAALFTPTTPAFASTAEHVVVKHNAYLIVAPHLHAARIALEHSGTSLSLESGSTEYYWHVRDQNGHSGYITRSTYWTALANGSGTNAVTSHPAVMATAINSNSISYTTTTHLPPGVTFDSSVGAVAPLGADYQTKLNAILKVAESKLGTQYVWGHNEDRGQYGFDCSNFTAYVYHHALGYIMSTSSQTQYHSVGTPVSTSSMRPGDLLVFNQGGHVGIYIGNGQMIQCGGGLAKVGYLKVSPGSYWYNHISSVKRMF